MATGIPARLTAAQGRRFGFTVGAAFLLLAAVGWWRGGQLVPVVLGGTGALLSLGGLLVPTHLGPVERAWMRLAHVISRVTTPIVMAVLYFVVLTPVGFLRRGLARNPLSHTATANGYWRSRAAGSRASSLERQF